MPLYPLVPALFVLTSSAMLISAVLYVQGGALFGLAILLAGVPVIWSLGSNP